ncbi:restriction endonuclease subunit S [Acinetobacter sp. YH16055]|uniref:restriction endonuclease subunit S n=1 Tax=Acinetobacter sp. YH16055 TaxID=2601193 RepID=UPI0015D3E724|nr:restriction endonuclease subunit S [Acinetobacter sp. YH16055]
MEFKQYPSYKPSGVEWLGDVPEHWQVKPNKYVFKIQKRIAGTLGFNVLSITQKGLKIKDIESNAGQMAQDYSKYQIVNIGDFAMNHMDLLTGWIDIAKVKGVTSPDYRVFEVRNKKVNKEYFLHLFQLGYRNKILFAFGQGAAQMGRWRLQSETFNTLKMPFPSIEEQEKIVAFLDTETTRIDNLIAKQEKLIELLEEQRKSIISHAVTKGLNPNAPMKDSGVEWLGDVPEHWEVFQLKSAIKGWRNGKWGNEPAAENNICCVRVADFDRTKGVINTTKLTYRNYHGENISECILDENSILIERSGGGEKQLVGATVVNTLKQTAVCSNFISLLNINPNRVNIFFLQKCFENLYTRKVNEKSIKQTSGIQNLDLKQYLQNNIAYPSLDEQKSIVSYLDAECKKIDLLVDKQYQLIRKLKNYRTSIISHAVTGKIDVREFGA